MHPRFSLYINLICASVTLPDAAGDFAVAVVRAESNITSLVQLRGRKSCHTGIGRAEGPQLFLSSL